MNKWPWSAAQRTDNPNLFPPSFPHVPHVIISSIHIWSPIVTVLKIFPSISVTVCAWHINVKNASPVKSKSIFSVSIFADVNDVSSYWGNVFAYGSLPGTGRSLIPVHKRNLDVLTFERALCRQWTICSVAVVVLFQ